MIPVSMTLNDPDLDFKVEEEEEEEFIFRTKTNIKMNKHANKVRKATGRADAITAGRQRN